MTSSDQHDWDRAVSRVRQSVAEGALAACPICGGEVERTLQSLGFHPDGGMCDTYYWSCTAGHESSTRSKPFNL